MKKSAKKPKSGSIYQQKGSKNWWIKFYVPGQKEPIRESAKTDNWDRADQQLKTRMAEVATGRFAGLEPERIKIKDLLEYLIEDYENNDRGILKQAKLRVNVHLLPFFGAMKATDVGTRHISAYIAARKKPAKRTPNGAANGTINRELDLLRRAFNLGAQAEPALVIKPPKVVRLEENNVREGILEHEQYKHLRDHLPPEYSRLLVCGYHLGTRLGELSKVEWSEVNFETKQIRLKRYNTKTKRPRILPIYGEMDAVLRLAKEERDAYYPNCPWVFQRKGEKFNFRWNTWNGLVADLGVGHIRFHDLRRTALTNLLEAGFSEKEAMEISGHTTRKTFERYHIVRSHRLQVIGKRMAEFYGELDAQQPRKEPGIAPGIAANISTVTH